MKNLLLFFLCFAALYSCSEAPKDAAATNDAAADSTAIAGTIHSFYQWYDAATKDSTKNIDFVVVSGKHNTLDKAKMEKYLSNIQASGFVSAAFIENDRAFYQACEKAWQNEDPGDVPTGMDGDKYFCAQDWDLKYFTTSPIRIDSLTTDMARATLVGTEEGSAKEQKFELKKENGKWLISKIECDMGVSEGGAAGSDQNAVEALAAFYTGTVPCADCKGLSTVLTLNADEQRTYTLEEEHTGKKAKKSDAKGTWTVAGDVVTLHGDKGNANYQVTEAGLISTNADGSKRDAKTAGKYLLKKTQGE